MIRKTLDTDIPAVMAIYDTARAFMRAHGNATQWPEGTPSAEQLAADIAAGGSYVCEFDGRVVATFAFLPGPDECYDVIEDGQWRSDTPYAVLHRVASDGTVHGIAAAMFAFAKERADHLRIDTHQDNLPMQGASIKAGFERAGRRACVGRHAACCVRLAARGVRAGARVNNSHERKWSRVGPFSFAALICKPAFARREPTKIAARQRRAMSLVGG